MIGFHTSPPTKKRENFTESSRLVSFLNGCQVVRMVELLGLLGSLDYIREEGGDEVDREVDYLVFGDVYVEELIKK